MNGQKSLCLIQDKTAQILTNLAPHHEHKRLGPNNSTQRIKTHTETEQNHYNFRVTNTSPVKYHKIQIKRYKRGLKYETCFICDRQRNRKEIMKLYVFNQKLLNFRALYLFLYSSELYVFVHLVSQGSHLTKKADQLWNYSVRGLTPPPFVLEVIEPVGHIKSLVTKMGKNKTSQKRLNWSYLI